MKIAVSIFFDSAYLEPALVTAHELLARLGRVRKIYLIFLLRGNAEDQESLLVIASFCQRFGDQVPIVPISLQNSLTQFSAAHFNNSIIYKALIPSIIQDEQFVLNLDAGILLGHQFEEFWQDLNRRVEQYSADWVIGAHCHEPAGWMPAALMAHPHNNLYPAGTILLFNCAQFNRRNWYERLVGYYLKFLPDLKYAEQELMCLTAARGEIMPLRHAERRFTPFLGADVLLGKAESLSSSCLDDCLFFKFVGSLKPWKYWVLDPNKSIYTRRRAELEASFPLAGFPVIERQRKSILNEDWALAFLRAYDDSLLRR